MDIVKILNDSASNFDATPRHWGRIGRTFVHRALVKLRHVAARLYLVFYNLPSEILLESVAVSYTHLTLPTILLV